MRAQNHISGEAKANTDLDKTVQTRHLMAIRIVGTAIFEYQVRKTHDARIRLESLATMAQAQGDLTDVEALVVAKVLATPITSIQQLQDRNHV